MNYSGMAVEPVIIGCTPGIALLLDILDRCLCGCEMNLKFLDNLGQGIGCANPFLNPETNDPKQEENEESSNGK